MQQRIFQVEPRRDNKQSGFGGVSVYGIAHIEIFFGIGKESLAAVIGFICL